MTAHTGRSKTLREELETHNRRLDAALRREVGICVKTYKLIKALTQLVGVSAAAYGMAMPGVDPIFSLILIASIILGPEYVESVLVGGEDGD